LDSRGFVWTGCETGISNGIVALSWFGAHTVLHFHLGPLKSCLRTWITMDFSCWNTKIWIFGLVPVCKISCQIFLPKIYHLRRCIKSMGFGLSLAPPMALTWEKKFSSISWFNLLVIIYSKLKFSCRYCYVIIFSLTTPPTRENLNLPTSPGEI
jgi:hypothetical protein